MSLGQGFLSTAGIKAETSWGEAWAAVDTAIPYLNESLVSTYDRSADVSLLGSAGMAQDEATIQNVSGDISFYLDYELNHGIILKAALGAESSDVYTLTDTLQASGNMFRIEFDKSVSRWRAAGCKVNNLTLSSAAGADNFLTATASLVAKSLSRSSDSFPAITVSGQTNILHSHLTFRLADKADALDSGDEMGVSSVNLSINNNLQADAKDSSSSSAILEPVRNGFRETMFDVELPRYTADTIQDWKDNDTILQADLTYTNGVNTLLIEIPELKIMGGVDANIGGAEVIPLTVNMKAMRNSSDSIMSAITDEVRITLT